MPNDPRAALQAIGELADDEIDLADAALHLARAATPGADWRTARAELRELARAAVAFDPAPDDLPQQARALTGLLSRQYGYRGDTQTYDAEANANLISVIERRRGLPVALGILWLHTARAAGVDAAGLDFPGHFLVALRSAEGEQVVVDPFDGGARRTGQELRELLRQVAGPAAALTPAMVRPMPDRAVLLRLQNNIRLRRTRAGDVAGALAIVEDMLLIAPNSPSLWADAAQLHEAAEQFGAAAAAWQRVVDLSADPGRAEAARVALAKLRGRLN